MSNRVPGPRSEARARLTRKMEFSSSHRTWRDDWAGERNRHVFGPQASSVSHGHNYELEVTLEGPVDPETGMVLDLKELREIMAREVEVRFDHQDLNDDTPFFKECPPTAECFGRVIFGLLDRALPAGQLYSVRLRPVEDLEVEVRR